MKKLLASIVATLCPLAHAAWEDQFAGLWLNPATPGWGISIHQQGDRMVATLLTYGSDGRARWYQAPDIVLPEWNPYVLWGTVFAGGKLVEGGTSRNAGSINFVFDEESVRVDYVVDGVTRHYDISRFLFSPESLHGTFTAAASVYAYGSCRAAPRKESMRFTASTAADNTVNIDLEMGGATCKAQGRYGYDVSTPLISGTARCEGLEGITEAPFFASDVRIGRDTLSFSMDIGTSPCGYYGPVVAARTGPRLPDGNAPHDDVSGLWTTDRGWSIAAHLQGNTLFGMVLAPDGSWYVAPDAGYSYGHDGDVVVYSGDLWSTRKATQQALGYDAARAGSFELSVDGGGNSSATYGMEGVPASAGRFLWPRQESIAGNYSAVRTNVMPASPFFYAGNISIADDDGLTRISFNDGGTERCEVAATLEWHGLLGRMSGSGWCEDGYTRWPTSFFADDVRITEGGLLMRYSMYGASGAIAALRR
jgi:hypothetical protein